MRLPVGRYLRAGWLCMGILLLLPFATNAQSTKHITLRQNTNKAPLPQGTQVTLLARQTNKKDPRGTWARLRILPGEPARLPEDTPANVLTRQTDVVQARGRTQKQYGQTGTTRTVYFAYARTADGTLYESVAWSAGRKRFEAAYERVGGSATFDMRRVRNAGRIAKINAAYFNGAAPPAQAPAPVATTPTDAPPADMPSETATPETPLNLRQLTLEYVEVLPEGPKVHLLPIGTQVVAFKRPAKTVRGGYASVPLADLNGDLPETKDPLPTPAKTSLLTFNGSALDLTLPTTSAKFPSAYLMYALTPDGRMFQSVAPSRTGHVPAYTAIDNSFFRMAPLEDMDRARVVASTFFSGNGATDGGPAAVVNGSWWTAAWVWWLAGLVGLVLLGALFVQLRRQQRTVNDPHWNAPLSAQPPPHYPEPEPAHEAVEVSLREEPPREETPALELNVLPSTLPEPSLTRPQVVMPEPAFQVRPHAVTEEVYVASASDLETLGDGGPDPHETSNMLRAFVEMDNALFRQEVAPHLGQDAQLEAHLRQYRRRVRENIKQIFLK